MGTRTCRRWLSTLLAVLALGAACGGEGASAPATGQNGKAAQTSQFLHLVAIGDSIPYNSPQDCPGCTGFADRYANAAEKATRQPVAVDNLSQHNNLTLPGLLRELSLPEQARYGRRGFGRNRAQQQRTERRPTVRRAAQE